MDNLQSGTAPKVTPADIEAEIASEHYFTADQGVFGAAMDLDGTAERRQFPALALLTICVITMRNGFTVTGESACASPENFDAEVGRKVARAAAISKCWPLLGFRLRDTLVAGTKATALEQIAVEILAEDAISDCNDFKAYVRIKGRAPGGQQSFTVSEPYSPGRNAEADYEAKAAARKRAVEKLRAAIAAG